MKERIGLFFVMCGWLFAMVVALVITLIAACIKIPYDFIKDVFLATTVDIVTPDEVPIDEQS